MGTAKPLNIKHSVPGSIPEHTPDMISVCPDCGRIRAFHKAYREFGYSTLTIAQMSESYEAAMRGEITDGDIIAILARRELIEAGIVKDR